jgi:hypothetical protein
MAIARQCHLVGVGRKWKLTWSDADSDAILAEKDRQSAEQRGSSQGQIVMREGDIVPLKRELDRMKAEIARLPEYEEQAADRHSWGVRADIREYTKSSTRQGREQHTT